MTPRQPAQPVPAYHKPAKVPVTQAEDPSPFFPWGRGAGGEGLLDHESWDLLTSCFEQLPHPVELVVWGEENASLGEREAFRLASAVASRFPLLSFRSEPRLPAYPYYPVIGVFGVSDEGPVDYGVRLIGLPAGVQFTSLIAAVQAVAFRGTTLEPSTRLQLKGLQDAVRLEILTAADDEAGVVVAKHGFGLAVAATSSHLPPRIRTYLIMADVFPEALLRYSAKELPHTVINGNYHVTGPLEEGQLLRHIAAAMSGKAIPSLHPSAGRPA
jgi:alkyl hydroperoxide reductase subunit AhpF